MFCVKSNHLRRLKQVMTKLAVLADIHGNSVALQAVLDDLAAEGGADHLIVLGDLVVFGPDPCGVLTLLKNQEPIYHVCGNTDRYLVEKRYPGGSSGQPDWQAQVLASFPWTAGRLSHSGLRFLASQPRQQRLFLTDEHSILAVHGSPNSDEEDIRPDTPDEELRQMLTVSPSFNLLLCAHTHVPVNRVVDGRRIVNVGSVGLPFDGDTKASYAIVHLEPGGDYRIEFRRVAYDIDAVVSDLFSVAHPAAEVQAYNLRTALPLSESLIYTNEMRLGHALAGANTAVRSHIVTPVQPVELVSG
jgi:putative phosphoesterase